jgi:hypothetical protein
LLARNNTGSGPIVALYDGSVAATRALRLAIELAVPVGELRVLVWAADGQAAAERRQLAERLLENAAVPAQCQHLAGHEPRRIIEWVNRQQGGLLVFSPTAGHLPADIAQILLNEAEQHILIVR